MSGPRASGSQTRKPSFALLHHQVAPRAGSREPARSTLFEAAFSRVEVSASWTRLAGRRILAVRGRGSSTLGRRADCAAGLHYGELPVRLQLRDKFLRNSERISDEHSPKSVRHELREIAHLMCMTITRWFVAIFFCTISGSACWAPIATGSCCGGSCIFSRRQSRR